ncbi:MAG: lysozyme inhibitor LprI family protein [Chthoniobacter sp.]|uniref:lysozyme inhibitor LprI family protein n=1 Tax=Chthoniobacter sp. TaxID=2510640 RepID=UPI0032AD0816
MKLPFVAPTFLVIMLLAATVAPSHAQSPLIPKGWIKADALDALEAPLQKQLDTGIAMLETAWDMATVKDAQLFIVYVTLLEKLPEPDRAALRKEQEAWLNKREKAAAKADDGEGGQIGHLQSATEHQEWSEKRIAELKKRMPKR